MRALRAIATFILIAGFRPDVRPERLPIARYVLGNGLVVMLAPDESVDAACVHVRYDVDGGAKLQPQLDAGSVHVTDFATRIEAAGGWATTSATADYLGMTEHVPAHALPLALWLEAERMAGLAEAIDDGALQRFARERISPNHATLVVTGRFDVVRARALVDYYFEWIPARDGVGRRAPAIGRFDPALELLGEVVAARMTGDVRVELARQRDGSVTMRATPLDAREPTQVTAALAREVRALRTQPPREDEITRARTRVLTGFYLAMEHLSVRAEQLANWSSLGREGSPLVKWPAFVHVVSRDDVIAAARRLP